MEAQKNRNEGKSRSISHLVSGQKEFKTLTSIFKNETSPQSNTSPEASVNQRSQKMYFFHKNDKVGQPVHVKIDEWNCPTKRKKSSQTQDTVSEIRSEFCSPPKKRNTDTVNIQLMQLSPKRASVSVTKKEKVKKSVGPDQHGIKLQRPVFNQTTDILASNEYEHLRKEETVREAFHNLSSPMTDGSNNDGVNSQLPNRSVTTECDRKKSKSVLPTDHQDYTASEDLYKNESAQVAAMPFSFPPDSHLVHLFKSISTGRLVSMKNLDEIDAYTACLRKKKLVTDFVAGERCISPPMSPALEGPVTATPEYREKRGQETSKNSTVKKNESGIKIFDLAACTCIICGKNVLNQAIKKLEKNKVNESVCVQRYCIKTGDSIIPSSGVEEQTQQQVCLSCSKVVNWPDVFR